METITYREEALYKLCRLRSKRQFMNSMDTRDPNNPLTLPGGVIYNNDFKFGMKIAERSLIVDLNMKK